MVRRHRPDLIDSAIFEYVSQADPDSAFSDQLERLLRLVKDLGPPPFELPRDKFLMLTTRQQFEEFGAHHRHCLESKFEFALAGRSAYAVFLPRPAIAVFVQMESGWLLSKVHCPQNRPVPPGLPQEITDALADTGIPFLLPAKMSREIDSVRRVFARYDPFGLDGDCVDGVEWA
jgi:hypothetical protein